MKTKIFSLADCLEACEEFNPNVDYAKIYQSIAFWLEKKQGKKQNNSKKIREVVNNGRRNL